jgi:hypothetical protein
VIIIYINNMTIAILIHKSVNCKCESMKSVNKDDEGRGGERFLRGWVMVLTPTLVLPPQGGGK